MAQALCFQQLLKICICEQDFQRVEFLTQRQKHQLGQSMPVLSGEKDLEAICILSPLLPDITDMVSLCDPISCMWRCC